MEGGGAGERGGRYMEEGIEMERITRGLKERGAGAWWANRKKR